MTTPVTPVADAALPLPDPEDLGTWGARMAEMHRWMREDLRTGMNSLGEDTYTNALAASSIANFVGAWSSLTGSLAIPASVSHGGKLWFLLASVADVTAETPGVSASWQDVTPLAAADVVQKIGGAARIPSWVTGGRPASPVVGDEGFNTTLGCKEQWNGTEWVQEGWQYSGSLQSVVGLSALSISGVPAWANEVRVHLFGVSSAGASGMRVRPGTAASIPTLGYQSTSGYNNLLGGTTGTGSTVSLHVHGGSAAVTWTGSIILQHLNSNIWVSGGVVTDATVGIINCAGTISLGGPLTRVEISSVSGLFDTGSFLLSWRK